MARPAYALLTATVLLVGLAGSAAAANGADTLTRGVTTTSGPTWSAVGSSSALSNTVYAVAGSGTNLYVGGNFINAGGNGFADYIANWNGTAWSALGSNGSGGALNGPVYAILVSGADVIVGGDFTDAGGVAEADNVARWNGSSWSALGSFAVNGPVEAMAGSSSDLYIGGNFLDVAGDARADYLAHWNGSAWSPVGAGPTDTDGKITCCVTALAVNGSNVYVGGQFQDAAGNSLADHIVLWNGSAWSALGSNGSGNGAINSWVDAVVVSGGNVYVGGWFDAAGGNNFADMVARWDGTNWHPLGANPGGTDGAVEQPVHALALSGGNLYVGGDFVDADGISQADRVAKWNGSSWSALGSNVAGTDGALASAVHALMISNGNLFTGGDFSNAADIPAADYVARYGPLTTFQPDGRIRKGSGSFIGNNIYNTTGLNQTKQASKAPGSSVTFGISIQNDGTAADHFKVVATGGAVTGYVIRYFRGTTEITSAVVAGTYQTSSLAVGDTFLIKAKVAVKSTAAGGSSVNRLVTLTSVGDAAKIDAVKFIVSRS